jgi:hypothetical protein
MEVVTGYVEQTMKRQYALHFIPTLKKTQCAAIRKAAQAVEIHRLSCKVLMDHKPAY